MIVIIVFGTSLAGAVLGACLYEKRRRRLWREQEWRDRVATRYFGVDR